MGEQPTTPASSSPSATPSVSSHWSESFVEHLRTVHFALSILAVAIIFTLLSGKEYDVQKAQTQASEILALSENWEKDTAKLFDSLLPAQGQHFTAERIFLTYSGAGNLTKSKNQRNFTVSKQDLMSVKQWQDFAGVDKRPTSVSSFRSWWNNLHGGINVPIPTEGQSGVMYGCQVLPVSPFVVTRSKPEIGLVDCLYTGALSPKPPDGKFKNVFCHDFAGYKKGDMDCTFDVVGLGSDHMAFGFSVVGPVSHVDEKIVINNIYGDWGPGDFQMAFPDLAKAASSNLEYVELKYLPERLGSDFKGDQVIEAFGLKIAAADVTRWGLLILLATQFYFWLHLHELTVRIEPTDPGWKVAWIGIYQPWLAFTTVIISACVLPLVAASLAGYRLRFEVHKYSQYAVAVTAVAISACLAIFTAFKLYKLRGGAKSAPPPVVYVPLGPQEPTV